MVYLRLVQSSAYALAFLGLSLVGCSDTGMSGKNGVAKPATDSAADASANDGSVPLNGTGSGAGADAASTDSSGVAPASASTDGAADGGATGKPGVPATLVVTKTITGLSGLEDKPVTLSIAAVDSNGNVGKPQTVTFTAGQSGSVNLPNVCNGPKTKIAVAVNTAASGGLGGLLGGGGGSSIATAAGSSGSSITFDPATCILTKLLQGNKGDTLNFTCSDNTPVSVVGNK